MKEISATSDAPSGWCKVSEIIDELRVYENEIVPKYSNKFSFEICFCFRCLDASIGRKSLRHYHKTHNCLYMDITIEQEKMRPFIDGKYYPLSKNEQRYLMGESLLPFLTDTFQKYKTKLLGIKEYGNEFISDARIWLVQNRWLRNNELGECPYHLDEISSLFIEINNQYKGGFFDKKSLPNDMIVKLQELKQMLEIYFKYHPNKVEALRIMSFLECYLLDFKSAIVYLEKAILIKNDDRDRVKLYRLKEIIGNI